MKRFIIISLLAVSSLTGWACTTLENHNYYLFSVYDSREFRQHTEQITNDNWKAYLGTKDDYFYFDADEALKVARQKNDALMVSYIQQLQRYLKCAEEKQEEQWEYPTKEQLARRTQTLTAVRAYAKTKLQSRLRSQHALLLMRCNMMLGRHKENITFYEQTGSKLIKSVYRDMMKNIYAGALYKTGQDARAGQLFAEMGDWESLMTQYYKRRSMQDIQQEYLRNPNSPVLPFLIQDFVNNTQEATDYRHNSNNYGGKLFIRNIKLKEALQMCQLCRQVVNEKKTKMPTLWMSAKAWIEYLIGNRRTAIFDIREAMNLSGTTRMKDNTRALHFFITASGIRAGQSLDNLVAQELTWAETKKAQDDHYDRFIDRLVHQVLIPKYASRPMTSLALMRATKCTRYDSYIDTMRVEGLLKYVSYWDKPRTSPLDRYLQPRQQLNRTALDDLIGTKYMRRCQWQQAVSWLKKVPASYYSNKAYAVYAANRRYTIEPWIKRQWLREGLEYEDRKWNLKANPKLLFAQEMQKLEASKKMLKGQALAQRCYDLAVRYAQASTTGDCWFLLHDGKLSGTESHVNEIDMARKARTLLAQTAKEGNSALRQRALFASCYAELYPKSRWYTEEWDDKTADYLRRPNKRSSQYQAFAAFANYQKTAKSPVPEYISRCDEYKQFRKHYR